LRVMVNDEALALRTGNERVRVLETWREWRPRTGGNFGIVSRGPAELSQIEIRICRRAEIMEPAAAAIEVQNQVRPDGVAVVDGERVGLIRFGAFVSAQPGLERIQWQIQQVPEIVAGKNVLRRAQVLIHTAYILIGIPARGPGRGEITAFIAVGRQRNELQFFQCSRINYGNRVVDELLPGATISRRDTSGTHAERIENRNVRREHSASLCYGGHRRSKSRGCALTISVVGEEEEGLVFDYRAAKRAAVLVLHVWRIRSVEKRPRVENLVAEVLVRFTVILIRPALRAEVDDTAGELA